MEDEKNIQIEGNNSFGDVVIADEVLAIIAGIAATEVEGVHSMDGGWSGQFISKLGIKDLARGVKVQVREGEVKVDLSLNMEYGYAIPKVSDLVQDKVSASINNMTGLNVSEVNIRISGVVNKENE
jgi:alkaline shock protein (fragment)